MKDVIYVKPSEEYQKSFEAYVTAYKNINDMHYFNKYKKALDYFQAFLNDLNNYSMGRHLPEGDGAVSTFWLVDKNDVVGVARIRHEEEGTAGHIGYDVTPSFRNKGYGNEILRLSLLEAVKLGIKEIIVTCSIENIASRKKMAGHCWKLFMMKGR